MEIVFQKNEIVYLNSNELFECGFSKELFPYKIQEIILPAPGQELTIRDCVKLAAGYGLRFFEIRNPKFPHFVPAFGDEGIVDLEPLFRASRFSRKGNGK